MVGFSFSQQILTQLNKFLRWRTLFLKDFYFSINFTSFLENIYVQQVVFKIRVFNQEKISDQHYGKILNQELKSWSTKYLKLKIKNKSWYVHDFFEPIGNNASSTSPFNATVIDYFDILIFWHFL